MKKRVALAGFVSLSVLLTASAALAQDKKDEGGYGYEFTDDPLNAGGFGLPADAMVLKASTVVTALVVGIGVTLAASIIPARTAAKVSPITALRDGVDAEEMQERRLKDGSRHQVYKRYFEPGALAAELGGGETLHAGTWFVVVRSR